MATIKSYTDLEQSKKLAEILPLERADMCYSNDGTAIKIDANPYTVRYSMWKDCVVEIIPCWSLAALLGVLPEYNLQRTDWGNKTEYKIVVTMDEDDYASKNYDNPLDACYEMILKLQELNLL